MQWKNSGILWNVQAYKISDSTSCKNIFLTAADDDPHFMQSLPHKLGNFTALGRIVCNYEMV